MKKQYDEIVEVNKNVDELEHVEKFNPFHDSRGRFATALGMKTYSANPKTKSGAMAIDRSTAAGYGGVMNIHRESKGENIRQNDIWIKSGKKPTPSQMQRAQAQAPNNVRRARVYAHTNRVKGTMGATEKPNYPYPSRNKTKPTQTQQKPQPKPQAQQNQTAQQTAQQANASAKTGHVKQLMRSGVTMDVDFDQSTVAGAKNKEFRGTAQGKDLTKNFDARKMISSDRYRGEERYTDKVMDMQGFNSPMKRVSKTEFNKLAKQNGDVFMREVDSTPNLNGRRATAKQMKQAYSTENDLHLNGLGGRAYGDGLYTASAAMKARNSRGIYKDHLDPAAQNAIRVDVRGYGDGQTVLKMAWLSKPNIVNQSAMENEWNSLTRTERAKFGNHMNTYAVAKGYDAMRTSTQGSFQDSYMVVFNRSKVAVLDD